MSVRMLRRALQSNPAADPGGDTASSGPSTSDVEADEGGGPVGNPFDLLGLQDEGEDGDSDVERDAHQQNDAASASTSAAVAVSVSRSKRKKGKNKKKGKKDLDTAESIDKLLERMTIGNDGKAVGARNGENLAPGNGEGFYTSSAAASQNGKGGHGNVLMADPKHLRAEDELRRIFGAKVINAVDRQEGVAAQRRRQGVPGRRGGRGLPLKKSMLVVPREDWIRWNSGMSMECIKVEGPIQHFRYQHSKSYEDVQHKFDACVASHDPNTIVMLLRNHPYHVDSLLAMSEFHKQLGDHQQAAMCFEQCLYALESAWHPWFTPASGSCRLEFAWGPNKPLFIALFRHMQTLGKRGCHRTAFEVCKFLLSLDPSDPLGAFFCIDYFALRAEQFEWLERFADEYKTFTTISLLPNFAFSLAVARFHLEGTLANHSNKASNAGDEDVGNETAATDLLRQALMLYPSALKKIIVKAPVKEDQSWSEILSGRPFDQSLEEDTELDHLVDIYVDRNGLIWRSPELQGWLKDAAGSLTQSTGSSAVPRAGAVTDDYDSVRQSVLRSVENECKNMRLHTPDSADSLPAIPMEEIAFYDLEEGDDVLEFLGRHVEENEGGQSARSRDGQDLEQQQQPSRVGELPNPREDLQQAFHRASVQGRNALLVFLQSLVPWMDQNALETVEDDAPVLLDEDDGHDRADEEQEPTSRNDNEHSH